MDFDPWPYAWRCGTLPRLAFSPAFLQACPWIHALIHVHLVDHVQCSAGRVFVHAKDEGKHGATVKTRDPIQRANSALQCRRMLVQSLGTSRVACAKQGTLKLTRDQFRELGLHEKLQFANRKAPLACSAMTRERHSRVAALQLLMSQANPKCAQSKGGQEIGSFSDWSQQTAKVNNARIGLGMSFSWVEICSVLQGIVDGQSPAPIGSNESLSVNQDLSTGAGIRPSEETSLKFMCTMPPGQSRSGSRRVDFTMSSVLDRPVSANMSRIHGCCWDTCCMFAYFWLVENPNLTAQKYLFCSPSNGNQAFMQETCSWG